MARKYTSWDVAPNIWTMADVCRELSVTDQLIRREIGKGQIKAKKCGREWRFTKDAVRTYVESGDTQCQE